MILGFTGTRNPISHAQREWLHLQLADPVITRGSHGACVNADEEFHHSCLAKAIPVTVHPPVDTKLMMTIDEHTLVTALPAKPYLDRNRDIVDAAQELLALPDGPERWTGGTWYTIHYAEGKIPIRICYPDGTVETR